VLFDSLLSFTIETGGKRKARILQAREQAALARVQAWEVAWQVRSRVRQALMRHLAAARHLRQTRERETILAEAVTMLEHRLAAGEIARPEVDTVKQQLASTRATLRDAEGQAQQTLAELASALGLPVASLAGHSFRGRSLEELPEPEDLPISEVQKSGLLHRADIRRALVEYAVAESAVRLEIADQYPDLQLGPGFIFEEGFARYVIAFSSMLPVFHRNRAAIAVAEAERGAAEARFESEQATAIGEMEQAVFAYAASQEELAESTMRLDSARRNVLAASAALKAGEGDRLQLAWERLLAVEASQARLDTLLRAQTALGALEDAVQHPLDGGAALSDVLLGIPDTDIGENE
jgi:outer membrane protein TolC